MPSITTSAGRPRHAHRWHRHAHRSDGLRRRILAVPVGVVAVALFAVLADGVTEHGDLTVHDPAISAWIITTRSPALTAAAQVVTTLGSEVAIGVLTALALVWTIVRQRSPRTTAVVATSMGVAAALTLGVKHLLSRPRPPAVTMLGPIDTGYAFPSGHTLFSTVFFGLAAGLVLTRVRRRTARVLVVVAWFVASAAVGLSRLYLGYHWFTDVAAGWALGVAVLTAALGVGWSGADRDTSVEVRLPGPVGVDGDDEQREAAGHARTAR